MKILSMLKEVADLWKSYRAAVLGSADDRTCALAQLAFYAGALDELSNRREPAARGQPPQGPQAEAIDLEEALNRLLSTRTHVAAFFAGGVELRKAIRHCERTANKTRPGDLRFGRRPSEERQGYVAMLTAECHAFLNADATRHLMRSVPAPPPDPELIRRFAWLFPPKDLHDPTAWDTYWNNQAEHHFTAIGMFEALLLPLGATIAALRENGLRSVLCVGSGASGEPAALAAAGFNVTVLELSPVAIDFARRIWGSRADAVSYIQGDLTDPLVCRGPFDAIIERRTLQLFGDELEAALDVLRQRLSTRGLFISHRHVSSRRNASNPARQFLDKQGWSEWSWPGPVIRSQCVWFVTSSG